MQRVSTPTAVAQKPAYATGGDPGFFTQGDPLQGIPATVPGQDFLNRIQEEICNVIIAAGIELDPTEDTQLRDAILTLILSRVIGLATLGQALAGTASDVAMTPRNSVALALACPTFLVASGTPDALAASMPAAPQAALTNGMRVRVRALSPNGTTTPTLNLTLGTTATGAKAIVKGALIPLALGDIPGAGAELDLCYNATEDKWVLLNPMGSSTQQAFMQGIINGALQVWQRGSSFTGIAGGVSKIIFLTGTGANTWTVPGDWNNSNNIVECFGAGGGGGGNSLAYSSGSGGGGGAYASRTNLPLSGTINYNVGVAGVAGGAGAGGGNGGDTFFNAASMPSPGTATNVGAKGGAGGAGAAGTPGVGGQASASNGSTAYSGGAGGQGGTNGSASGAGGGGGCAGKNGNGGAGGTANNSGNYSTGGGGSGGNGSGTAGGGNAPAGSASAHTAGGNNAGGTGAGAVGTAGTNGGGGGGGSQTAAGGAGSDYTATVGGTAGPGGGGGGGAYNGGNATGCAGGLYGGGGGGCGGYSGGSFAGAPGAQGLILISYTPIAGATYTADCWFAGCGGTSPAGSASRVAGANGFQYGLKLQRPAANTAIGSHQIGHIIASIDCARFRGQSVTLSFWANAGANFSASGNNLAVKLYAGTGVDEGAISMQGGTWTGSTTPLNTSQALSTSLVQYSFTCTIPANAMEIGILLGWTPTGTAGADDSFTIQGVALKPSSAGAGSVYDFPQFDLDLYECRTRCEVAAGYIPATTAQNIRSIHLRAAPAITGGGAGFTSTGTTKDALVAYQTTGAVQTLTLSADL